MDRKAANEQRKTTVNRSNTTMNPAHFGVMLRKFWFEWSDFPP